MGFQYLPDWLLNGFFTKQEEIKQMDNVRVLGELQKLSLKDGDTVVLMTDKYLTYEQIDTIKSNLGSAFKDNKALVLEGGMKVGVMGEDERLDRIESKITAITELLAVLLDSVQQEDEDHPVFDLDGNQLPQERDENQSLG